MTRQTKHPFSRSELSSADLNRALHNAYYGICFAKAGVAGKLRCWVYYMALATGQSDEDCQQLGGHSSRARRRSIVFMVTRRQTSYFWMFLDKGIPPSSGGSNAWTILLATGRGEQNVGGSSFLGAARVAAVRSGNERGVNRVMMS